jgi:HNH endonuclease
LTNDHFRQQPLSKATLANPEALDARIRAQCQAQDGRPGSCWVFYGPREKPPRDDYAIVWITQNGKSRPEYVHRVMYALHKGDIAPGQEIRHLCQKKRCCKPSHLEAGTSQENRDWDKSIEDYLDEHLGSTKPSNRIFANFTLGLKQAFEHLPGKLMAGRLPMRTIFRRRAVWCNRR